MADTFIVGHSLQLKKGYREISGPGCSSLGGAMHEIGPFFVNRDNKTLSKNKYAWNSGMLIAVIYDNCT
jgi:hypothetical protein